jgi:hypothetical protein
MMVVTKMSEKIYDHIIDAVDVETFILCKSEDEGKDIMLGYLDSIGLSDSDIVFVEYHGLGVRIRARGYIFRPGDQYRWLQNHGGGEKSGY